MWFHQYIIFFFTKHFKFISICFEVLSGLFWNNASMETRERIHECFGRNFVLKWTRLPPTDRYIGSENRDPAFCFYRNRLSGYWSRQSYVHNGQSVFVWVKWNFSYSEIRGVNDVRRCHVTWNERIHKESQFYSPEKHHKLCLKKNTMSDFICNR